jgi:hypothetical protein
VDEGDDDVMLVVVAAAVEDEHPRKGLVHTFIVTRWLTKELKDVAETKILY